jgi:hypothetical protein
MELEVKAMSLIKVDLAKVRAQKKIEQEKHRQSAYAAEADPIAMQMLRDEATKEEWLAKIKEIKARYPYPDE